MFLEAAKYFVYQNPDLRVKFVIVGGGELRERLKTYAKQLGIEKSIHFYGWANDISTVYSDLDILALTSLNEGTPVSIIEAMASQVPVISTDAGGVVDLIGIGNDLPASNGFKVCERGILCRKNDVIGFSEGLKYLVSIDEGEKRKMLSRAWTFVKQKYSQERLLKDIEGLYLELVKDNYGRL